MTDRVFEVEVQEGHLQKISNVRKPIYAIAELIWNSLDADASIVEIFTFKGLLAKTDAIQVTDNGHGIPYEDAVSLFSRLGGSWKQARRRSWSQKRLLHGKEGKGRFRALSLGRVVEWNICYQSGSDYKTYVISMMKDNPKLVRITEEMPLYLERSVGVVVTISEIEKDFNSLDPTFAVPELTQIFALYLRRYPSIVIRYDKVLLEPHTVELSSIEYEIEQIVDEDGQHLPAKIEIVEWKMPTERRMYFCDWAGFPLDEFTPGVQAPGFSFTCYLKCDHFSRLLAENRLEIANLDSTTARLLEAARKKIREHFRRRASEQAIGLVAEWQRDHVYPYQGEPVVPLTFLSDR